MKLKTRDRSGMALWRGLRMVAAGLVAAMMVAACGGDTEAPPQPPFGGNSAGSGGGGSGGSGGSGGGGGSGSAQTTVALTLKLTDSTGAATSTVLTGQPLRAQAVLTRSGQPVVGEIVQFSIDQAVELVRIDPVAGSLLTAADGTAIVTLSSLGASTGAGTLKATAKVGDETVTAGANFFASGSSGTPPASLSLGPVKISSASVSAYGTTGVEVQVLQNGAPYTSPVTVNFTSSCAAGKANVTPSAATTPSGVAVGTFVDNGCAQTADATVTITASIATDSESGSMLVKAPTTGSLRFVSVDPSDKSITLRGQGGNGRQENATVTFKLVDVAGQGVGNADVCFDVSTYIGGLNLDGFSPTSLPSKMGSTTVCGTDPLSQIRYLKRTNSDGTVSVQVNSGSVPTPVRVRARSLYPSTASVPLESFSDTLSISTGLPLQRSFSLSVDKANIDGGNFDGEIAKLTVRLADQFSNPVPDGTVVNFIGSGAAVCTADNGSCKTTNGACSCDVVSQARRPMDNRVVVTAYAVGMEDFDDLNGDNRYTSGVDGFDLSRQDLGDAYVDANKDGVYGDGSTTAPTNPTINGDTDIPIPYQKNDVITVKGDGVRGTAHIRASTVIYLSQASSAGDPTVVVPLSSLSRSYPLGSGGTPSAPFVRLKPNCPKDTPVPQATVFAMLDDGIGNPMAAGTTLAVADASNNISPAGFRPSSVLAIGTRPPSPGMDLPNTQKASTWTAAAANSNVPSAHSITVRGVEEKCSGDASFALEVKSPRGGSAGARVLYEGDPRSTARGAFDVRYREQVGFRATADGGLSVTIQPDSWVGSAAGSPVAQTLEIDWGDGSPRTTVTLPGTLIQSHTYSAAWANTSAAVTVTVVDGSADRFGSSRTVTVLP